jgi:hypothetical protein
MRRIEEKCCSSNKKMISSHECNSTMKVSPSMLSEAEKALSLQIKFKKVQLQLK